MLYIVKDKAVVLFIHTIRIEHIDHKVDDRKIIYVKFEKHKINMPPRDVYNETIETSKVMCDDYSTKNNHSYYI